MKCTDLADGIVARLIQQKKLAKVQWQSSGNVEYFVIDDLLSEDLCHRIRNAYPAGDSMRVRKSLRELKYVAAQMDKYDPILEDALYAFQDPRVVQLVEE